MNILSERGARDTSDGESLAELAAAFGIDRDKPIDTVTRRLHAWALVAAGGSINLVQIDGMLYSWDARPRLQKNGAAIGRVYAQARGQLPRDIGAYKISADGRVLRLPAALQSILPGGLEAESSGPGIDEPQEAAS